MGSPQPRESAGQESLGLKKAVALQLTPRHLELIRATKQESAERGVTLVSSLGTIEEAPLWP